MLGLYYSTHIHKSPLCRPIVNSSIDQVCMGSQVDSPDHRSVKPYGLYNLWSRHNFREFRSVQSETRGKYHCGNSRRVCVELSHWVWPGLA